VLENNEEKYPGIREARAEKEVLGIVGVRSLPPFECITSEERDPDCDAIKWAMAPISRHGWIIGQLDVGVRVSP
jgi:hypothetical protein